MMQNDRSWIDREDDEAFAFYMMDKALLCRHVENDSEKRGEPIKWKRF